MLKKYVGKNRAEILDWLLNRWLNEGPPVCFLEGFPGVGKTDLARDFRDETAKQLKWQRAVIDEVPDRATPSVMDSLLDLSDKFSRQGLPEMEKVLLGDIAPNPAYALEQALKCNVVIILDEAQRFFRSDSGAPLSEMGVILDYLRYRQDLPGRLLLLSDRVVERARWSEWIPKKELKKLEPSEALEAFDDKLVFADIKEEIPAERKQEIVQALDYNPRAIETLVASLAYETLDDVMGRNRGLWDVRDREISRDFLNKLERDLLERTMAHLDTVVYQRLLRLSVHRKSFEKAAIELVCGSTRKDWQQFRDILVTRFVMNQRSGWLALNPIVREIALAKLKDQPAEFLQAHERAADYHMRHFKARTITADESKLGASFAELRYHLAHSGRKAELRQVVHRFTDFLKLTIKGVTPVPTDREELDERIAVLSALLEEQGADSLEYQLARCLKMRNRPGDWKSGLIHVTRITRVGSPAENWFLRAELEAQVCDLDVALRTIYEAIHKLSTDGNLFSIYQLGAKLLAEKDRVDEAVALLKEGIKVVTPDKSLHALYYYCAELLTESGRPDEAIQLLMEGAKIVTPDKTPYPDKGLEGLIERIRNTPKKEKLVSIAAQTVNHTNTANPQIYVSYAWGEDSSETGRKREEIVDRLCDAVVASGRPIGRDKDRMQGGDSIERFANEISKAERIVGVISEKFLRSKYCMVLELYAAWRRCNHKADEFQKKVIALVMDDARASLDDDLQVAKFWKGQYEKEKADLLAVDPDRHSIMRWAYVNQLGEMCPKVPDMLGAIKDIVMKRGFEEIVKDNFNEVIGLLPLNSDENSR